MNIKTIITLLIVTITTVLPAAEDKPVFTYEGEVAGVVCNACASNVKAALSKLDGVTSVKIKLGKEGSAPRMEVISSSPNLTKEAAIKALGEKAAYYVIQSFKLVSK